MSFKKFSTDHSSPVKESPDDTSKPAPPTDRPATQPDRAPAEVAPAPKS